MNRVWRNVIPLMAICLLMMNQPAIAQPRQALSTLQGTVVQLTDQAKNAHLKTIGQRLQQELALAADRHLDEDSLERLEQKVKNLELLSAGLASLTTDQQAAAPFVVYGVPAMSSIKRLPETVPTDGQAGKLIGAVAARGEYAPLSLVVASLTDVAHLEVRATDLASKAGVIPSANIDIKVIKVWYQTGTAWHSYFADPTHRVLVPELLLNDENLIRVDQDTQDNYLRVDYPAGPKYIWISAPPQIDDGAFNHHLEPVADSPVLLPVVLQAGQSKQFWITIKVPANAAPGLYEGSIELVADGAVVTRLALPLRVLPFELPQPRTYYDLNQQYYTMMYNSADLGMHLDATGGNWELSVAKLRAELRDMRQHNLYNHLLRGQRAMNEDDEKIFVRSLELVKEAGFEPPLFGGFSASGTFFFPKDLNPERFEQYLGDAKRSMELIKKILGHSQVYMFGFDEPSTAILLSQQDGWRELHRMGIKIYSTSKDTHYPIAGYSEDVANYSGNISREKADKWHMLGNHILNYAGPHTGPENPEFNRRTHGLQLYKANFDGTGNYKYYDQHKTWNDFASTRFRGFNMVYPTQTGVIDTMAWEAFRTGIDDVRYATLLKTLAAQAISSQDVDSVYAGKKALLWLELADEKTADLDAIRMEMINYILDLSQRLGKGDAR